MSAAKYLLTCLLGPLLLGLGCTPPRPIGGVWRPGFGEDPDRIPGPMKNFGPFDSYTDALLAACPLILSKPNATVGHLQDVNPEIAQRVATEYCAWLYYTPEHRYEMSMLTDRPKPDDLVAGKKTCMLPRFVTDSRYDPGDLRYIFALHNHPFGKQLSLVDLHFIEAMASQHDWKTETKNGEIHLSIIAFFSHSMSNGNPNCDGFHQYVPATREIMTWVQTRNGWKKADNGILRWLDDRRYIIEKIQHR